MAPSSTSLPRFYSPVHPVVRYKRHEEDCEREGSSAYSDSRGHPVLISSCSNSNSSDSYDDMKCDQYDPGNDSRNSKSKSSTRETFKITVTIGDEAEELECEDDVGLRSESHYLKGCAWRKQGIA
jgi:hypothetical protein